MASDHVQGLVATLVRVYDDRTLYAQEAAKTAELIAQTELGKKLGEYRSKVSQADAEIKTLEDTVRREALAEWEQAQEKQVKWCPGVHVVQNTKLSFDPAQATAWCRVNAPAFLVLDQKAFGKSAMAGLPGAPVEIKKVAEVEIARSEFDAYRGEQ
jgi:hypothetical protein